MPGAEATLDQFVVELDAETTRIAGLLQAISDQDLSSQEVTDRLAPIITALKALGTNPPTP